MHDPDDPDGVDGGSTGRTFENSKFQPGVSGNRRGRPPKQKAHDPMPAVSEIDFAVVRYLDRSVRNRDGNEASMLKAAFQKAGIHAFNSADADGKSKRGGALSLDAIKFMASEGRRAHEKVAEFSQWLARRKAEFASEAERRRRRGARPPETLPHPDHIDLTADSMLRLRGPHTREGQQAWELIKYNLRAIAHRYAELRRAVRKNPADTKIRAELAVLEKYRRAWMRKVPKGWKWTEKVITCDSDPASLLAAAEHLMHLDRLPNDVRPIALEAYREFALVKSFTRD